MKVKIKKIGTGIPGPLPTKASSGAACYDVVATKIEEISPGKVKVYLGFATEIAEGYKGIVVPRSSFTHKDWVMQNSPAQIDHDYRGEWMLKYQCIPGINAEVLTELEKEGEKFMLENEGKDISEKEEMEMQMSILNKLMYKEFPYKVGDRVAQIYFERVLKAEFVIVIEDEVLNKTERGSGGFGSTGNKADVLLK